MTEMTAKKILITLIALTVGLLHFVTGENYRGPFPAFVNGYLIDILLPMVLYFLLDLPEIKWIKSPIFRATAVFLFGCTVEMSQYLGYPLFGSTFDPLDILAYAGSVVFGVFLDLILFPRTVPFWNYRVLRK
jgi:hypothetical protein